MSNDKIYEIVTDKMIAALESGIVPWHKPWKGGELGWPRSMANGRPYRGINVWLLAITQEMNGYQNRHWGTYKNIGAHGGQVRKGEKSTLVVLWKPMQGPDRDNPEKIKRWFMLRYFTVFNAEQADWPDGLPSKWEVPPFEELGFDAVETAEATVAAYLADGPRFEERFGDRAYYSPSQDLVVLPERKQFDSTARYYSTLFHELTHSTGHKDRLAREGVTDASMFGGHLYAAEELIAEMGAAYLCGVTGVDLEVEQNASYIDNWLSVFKKDRKVLISAAGKAQRAADLVAGITPAAEESTDTEEAAAAA